LAKTFDFGNNLANPNNLNKEVTGEGKARFDSFRNLP
jgi:hypothetical protein